MFLKTTLNSSLRAFLVLLVFGLDHPQPSFAALENVVQVAAGGLHTCAVTAAGGAKCWGYNEYGQLGDGTYNDSNIPVDVAGLGAELSAISAGLNHTCALTRSGGVKCWGTNSYGELGDSTDTDQFSAEPHDVSGLTSGVIAIAAGADFSCAVTSSGAAKCWGFNVAGQLGDGTTSNRTTAVNVSGLSSGVIAITAGEYHACALIVHSRKWPSFAACPRR